MAKYNKSDYLKYQELAKSLKLTSGFWKKQGEEIKKWIWRDAKAGILQTEQKHHQYISEQYKKYKANWMRRFTRDVKTKGTSNIVYGRKTKKATIGKSGKMNSDRVGDYGGTSIVSNRTSTVDMMLTGQLIQGLHFVYSNALGGVMSYLEKDAGKIEGNRKYGREICTLREENRQKLIKNVSKELDVNIRQWCKDKVYINYGNK